VNVKKEKKDEKEKRKNIVKVNVCVCICFMDVLFYFIIKLQRIKKNLIFWFAHGPELLTYT